MNRDEEQIPLCIHLDGPAFMHKKESFQIDLFSLSQTIMDIQHMLDRSYAVLSGSQRVTQKDRQEFKLIANKFAPGSLEITALLSLTPAMIPLITEYGPTAYKVIETTIKAFELGKKLREIVKNGGSVQPSIINYNNVGMVNNGSIENVVINNSITKEEIMTEVSTYFAALQSSRSHERLVNHTSNKSVTKIALSTCENGLKMETSVTDKLLFKSETRLDDSVKKYYVKIHALDVETSTGELRIYEEDRLSNPIRFSIIGSQELKNYSLALNIDKLSINALPEFQTDLSGKKLVKLHVANLSFNL
ncbi:hypothetical protein [Azotosporobacter soli]|uniref:hypothetical protein n=1 Tax=Azotosporobacter soli TaxID=3055040 RepID=UPI0031FEB633